MAEIVFENENLVKSVKFKKQAKANQGNLNVLFDSRKSNEKI
jgi:hypothetical protein